VRPHRAGALRRIGVRSHTRLTRDVARGVIGEALLRLSRHLAPVDAVQFIVVESLIERTCIPAHGTSLNIAQHVIGIALLHPLRVGGGSQGRIVQACRVVIEALGLDKAIAQARGSDARGSVPLLGFPQLQPLALDPHQHPVTVVALVEHLGGIAAALVCDADRSAPRIGLAGTDLLTDLVKLSVYSQAYPLFCNSGVHVNRSE
jgi:hypothetical protein